jgi:Zn-dependent protease with chaperone function
MNANIPPNLKAEAYEHPSDRKALAALEKMPGVSTLFKKINEYGIDRLLRLQCTGSDLRVNVDNFPALHRALVQACEMLAVPLPELYLMRGDGHIETYTYGVEQPLVMLNINGMEQLSPAELVFLFGHEIAHIKSNHLLYHQTAIVLPALRHVLTSTTLGLGGLATGGIEIALYHWVMMAKFTADRAGLLACQDLEVALSTLIKLAGLPNQYLTPEVIAGFRQQALEFDVDGETRLDQVAKTMSFTEYRFPWSVFRAAELMRWVESGEYEALLQGEPTESSEPSTPWNFLTSW